MADRSEVNDSATVEDNNLLINQIKEQNRKEHTGVTEGDNEGVPTDSGYAWVIVLNVFLIMAVIVGFNRSLSVLFKDISEEFQQTATTVSLMFTLHALSSSVSSMVVSNIIMSKTTIRNISVVAAVVSSATSVAMSRAPNIVLFLLLFIVKGTVFGALLVGPMSLIGFYFKKRRSLASSIATAGMCASFIVFPPIAEALRKEFGMRGAFLILAAIELHLVACSLTLRSVESYKALHKSNRRKTELKEAEIHLLSLHDSDTAGDLTTVTVQGPPSQRKEEHAYEDKKDDNALMMSEKDETYTIPAHTTTPCPDYGGSQGQTSAGLRQTPNGLRQTPNGLRQTPNGSPVLCSLLEVEQLSQSHVGQDVDRGRQAVERSVTFERQTSHLSAMSLTEIPYIMADDKLTDQATRMPRSICSRLLHIFIDFSLFKIWRFRMMTVFVPLSVFANYTIIYMPLVCTTLGISKTDGAMLMTLSGVMDMVTRIATGFVGDFQFVSKPKLVAASLLVVGTVCHSVRFFTSYAHFVVYAVLIGVFGGVRQNFFNVMLMDYVGVNNMPKAYGLASTLATLCLSINHPIIAALYDNTKGFAVPLHYVGVMIYLGTAVLLLEPVFTKLDKRNIIEVK